MIPHTIRDEPELRSEVRLRNPFGYGMENAAFYRTVRMLLVSMNHAAWYPPFHVHASMIRPCCVSR
jgi:hypothetical protein